jgi:hypothetical protein
VTVVGLCVYAKFETLLVERRKTWARKSHFTVLWAIEYGQMDLCEPWVSSIGLPWWQMERVQTNSWVQGKKWARRTIFFWSGPSWFFLTEIRRRRWRNGLKLAPKLIFFASVTLHNIKPPSKPSFQPSFMFAPISHKKLQILTLSSKRDQKGPKWCKWSALTTRH